MNETVVILILKEGSVNIYAEFKPYAEFRMVQITFNEL